MDWNLVGTFGDLAGTSGVAQLPAGACVTLVSAHASQNGATFQIFNGATVPVINGAATIIYEFDHLLVKATGATPGVMNQITFVNTDHYYIQYVQLRH